MAEQEWPAHALPASLQEREVACKFCRKPVRWGKTTLGRSAPFDVEPPHPNHWITCEKRATATRYFRRGRRAAQNGS